MHNAIQYAVDRVRRVIPRDILEDVFGQAARNRQWGASSFSASVPVSLDARIISEVIDGRVRGDSDLTGAKLIDVMTQSCVMTEYTDWSWVIHVPDEATGGCRITQFLGIYLVMTDWMAGSNYPWLGQNELAQGGYAIAQSYGNIPTISTENGHIIGHNTIEVVDQNIVRASGFIRCKVDSDESMSHLQPGSYQRFADLVVLATKSYIYNTLVVQMGRGKLEAGYDLGVYKDVVDEYRDSEESYQEMLRTVWRRVSEFNDPNRRRRYHRFLLGRR